MWTCKKFKLAFLAAGICFTAPVTAQACIPLNPLCLFQMLLKVTPGMPVMDFVSIPAVIPHVPAALQKEANAKIKQLGDDMLQKIRSGQMPSLSDIDMKPKTPEFEVAPEGQVYGSLEALPNVDLDDPMEISKAIEVLYVRPGWQTSQTTEMTIHDKALVDYYRKRFAEENLVEGYGQLMSARNSLKDMSVFAEHVQKQMESSKDVNDALRANYMARYMRYQLKIINNQLLSVDSMVTNSKKMGTSNIILEEPVLGAM